jgi:hypothetical protein
MHVYAPLTVEHYVQLLVRLIEQREPLTNLEKRTLQRRRWLREDPDADDNMFTFEEYPKALRVPEDMVFGYITNDLRWKIFDEYIAVSTHFISFVVVVVQYEQMYQMHRIASLNVLLH